MDIQTIIGVCKWKTPSLNGGEKVESASAGCHVVMLIRETVNVYAYVKIEIHTMPASSSPKLKNSGIAKLSLPVEPLQVQTLRYFIT